MSSENLSLCMVLKCCCKPLVAKSLTYLDLKQTGHACLSCITDIWIGLSFSFAFTHSSSAAVAIFSDCKMWLNWRNNNNVFRLYGRVVLPFSLASLARPADGFPVFWPVSQGSAKKSVLPPFLQSMIKIIWFNLDLFNFRGFSS